MQAMWVEIIGGTVYMDHADCTGVWKIDSAEQEWNRVVWIGVKHTCRALYACNPSYFTCAVFFFVDAVTDLKISSAGLKKYTISWDKPSLPDQLKNWKYYASYHAMNKSSTVLNISNEMTSVTIDVEYGKKYTFQIQVGIDGEKGVLVSRTWISHSGMVSYM